MLAFSFISISLCGVKYSANRGGQGSQSCLQAASFAFRDLHLSRRPDRKWEQVMVVAMKAQQKQGWGRNMLSLTYLKDQAGGF